MRENGCWALFSLLELSSVGLNVDVAGEVRAFYLGLPGLLGFHWSAHCLNPSPLWVCWGRALCLSLPLESLLCPWPDLILTLPMLSGMNMKM